MSNEKQYLWKYWKGTAGSSQRFETWDIRNTKEVFNYNKVLQEK